jgi:GNAT superfamily N-acetyltransferase
MEFRTATQNDIPAILACLKRSLGEVSSPKTREYWTWKHIANPFGESPVLIAIDQDKIVGVRAFMRWSWRWKGKNYSALRAVDTATDPDYQGQGIFKKLTLTLLDKCKEEGDDFIFNTPNTQSLPGYLKMGWSKVGKLPVRLKIKRPLSMALNYMGREVNLPVVDKLLPIFHLETAMKNFDDSLARYPRSSGLYTVKNKDFLTWRYVNCPIVHYYGYVETDGEHQILLIFYPKKQKFGVELRICEIQTNSPLVMKRLKRALRMIAHRFKPDYFSVATLGDSVMAEALQKVGFGKARNLGPVVTLRPMNDHIPLDWFKISPWDATLGDLELF